MLIFDQLLPHCCRRRLIVVAVVGILLLLLVSWLRRLVVEVVVVGVSSASLFLRCRQRCPFLWLRLSASAPCRQQRLVVVVGGGVAALSEKLSLY